MPRYLSPPPTNIEALWVWLSELYQAVELLENFVVTNITGSYTVRPEESGLFLVANTAPITVTLPDPVVLGKGWKCLFIKTTSDAQIVTLAGTINGAANNTQIDAQYDRIGVVSSGTNFLIYEREIS